MRISVIIHTLNADKFLERVLESVKGFDEVIVCDMHSTDRTLDIAQKSGCKIIFFENPNTGHAEPARSYSISQATSEWVFMVDADELVSDELRKYLYETIKEKPEIGGLRVARKNYLMGRFMRSAYPDYILRFFKREGTVWPPTVHSQPILKSGIVLDIPKNRMDLAFIHLSNEPIQMMLNKMNIYSNLEGDRRKNKKYTYFSLIIEPAIRFVRLYFLKGGFLDGIPGLVWARQHANYKFVTIVKVLESRVKVEDYDKDLRG